MNTKLRLDEAGVLGRHLARLTLRTILLAFLLLTFLLLGIAIPAAQSRDGTVLRAAWVPMESGLLGAEPRPEAGDAPIDLRMLSAIAERADIGVTVVPMGRAAAERALAQGGVDIVLPVAGTASSASVPYRSELSVLLCARGLPALHAKGTRAIREAYARSWRIAFLADGPYRAGIVRALRSAPAGRTVQVVDIAAALAAVMAEDAHCIVAPRLAILDALVSLQRAEAAFATGATDLGMTPLRIGFAPALPPETVAAFNAAIEAVRDDGTAHALELEASRPILLRFAVAAPWFSWLDIIGTVAFALSGVLIARAESFSFLGAFVLAGLPAVGGGVMRDLLVGRDPIGILASPLSLQLVIGTVLAAYLAFAIADRVVTGDRPLQQRLPRALSPLAMLEVTDAIGLAAFTVLGVSVAVQHDAEPLWLWGPFLAALSGAGGGILRDLLRTGYENPALRTSFYAEVCVIWGLALTLAIIFLLPSDHPAFIRVSIAVTVLGAFITRLVVVATGFRSPRF